MASRLTIRTVGNGHALREYIATASSPASVTSTSVAATSVTATSVAATPPASAQLPLPPFPIPAVHQPHRTAPSLPPAPATPLSRYNVQTFHALPRRRALRFVPNLPVIYEHSELIC